VRAAPIIDEEFRSLLPALTPDQRAGLEASILTQGILSPLLVWEETGVLASLKTIDKNLHDVISDIMDEKRDELEEWLEEQEED